MKQTSSATAVSQTITRPSLLNILLYAGLTAVTLLLLITATRAIGQAPLFSANQNNMLPTGWRPITDSQLRFTLNLPATWHVFELAKTTEAAELRQNPPIQTLDQTFESLAADVELLFLGTEDGDTAVNDSPVFVLVAQSQRLQRLTLDEILVYTQERLPENITLSAIPTVESTNGAMHRLLFNIEQDGELWRCLEHVDANDSAAYLVVTCTSFAQFPIHLSEFETILDSFQLLG